MSVTSAAAAFRFAATPHALSASWSAGALTLCEKAMLNMDVPAMQTELTGTISSAAS
jgi:hypothetical protein